MRRNPVRFFLTTAAFAAAMVLGAAGGLLLWGSAYIHNNVQGQLAAQQIFFPDKAAFAHPVAGGEITPSMIPVVSQYAGQQLLTGQQAAVYANDFIAVHIKGIGGGKTYSQLSAASMAQPSNTKLSGQVATVFKGETLRSVLLNAFGWWKVSQIAYICSLVSFGLGGLVLLGGVSGSLPAARLRPKGRSPTSRSTRSRPPDPQRMNQADKCRKAADTRRGHRRRLPVRRHRDGPDE